jgi:hypothetical protein
MSGRERRDNRDKPREDYDRFKWKGDHERMGCDRGCVSPSSHFLKWRDAYSGDLDTLLELAAARTGVAIPRDVFTSFAYEYSSGYFF